MGFKVKNLFIMSSDREVFLSIMGVFEHREGLTQTKLHFPVQSFCFHELYMVLVLEPVNFQVHYSRQDALYVNM